MRENLTILKPININGMVLKNRLANAPFGCIPSGDGDGYITDMSLENCRTLFASGVSMVMCGMVGTNPAKIKMNLSGEKKETGLASIADDRYIPGWKRLADYAHSFDCKLGIQIGEWGPVGLLSICENSEEVEKYAQTTFTGKPLEGVHVMTEEELDDMVEYVAQSARRAKEAGIDCVEVHAAHSSALLYANALDPFFNHRNDKYGGDLERNLYMHIATIKRIRELVGSDYPVLIRINGDDLKGELGNNIEEVCKYIVPRLEEAGYDAIDVSMGGPVYCTQGSTTPMYYPRGCWMHLAKAVKQVTKLPVIGVGRITTVEMAEKYLREGWCDIMYMGRQILADEHTLQNYVEGKNENKETRQCIACLKPSCKDCTVNFERYGSAKPGYVRATLDASEKPRKMLIIGGGVAGMEAARVAALKGHQVTLWEKEGVLGGIAATLATTRLTSEMQNIVDYEIGQLSKLGVDVRCCYEATIERIKEFAPDTVILASGCSMPLPENIDGEPMVMNHLDAMRRKREFRSLGQWHKKVVFYGFTASEFALDLAEEGADVVLMGAGGEKAIAAEGYMTRERKLFIRRKLTDVCYVRRSEETRRVYNPQVICHAKLEGVDHEGIHYYHNGIHKTMPYDVLIYSGPRRKNDSIFEELKNFIPEVYKIGDCDKIGNITSALHSANLLVREL